MSKGSKNAWYKLDNAAKIFPPASDNNDPHVFRISCELKELVDGKILQEALDKNLEEYPMFLSSLKKGFFWYYLERINELPKVEEERTSPCEKIDTELLFRVTYFKRRINVEVYHSLTDGTGTLSFLKSLIIHYLTKKHNIKEKIIVNDSSVREKENDSFEKYYQKNVKMKIPKGPKAHTLKGERFPEDRLKIIEGISPVKEIKQVSKQHNTTITIFLASLLIKSIGLSMTRKEKRKPIVVTVPVNLRNYFKSQTARNFFSTIEVIYKFSDDNDDIDSIIASVSKQFSEKLETSVIEDKMNSLALLENIFILRLVPVFIKDLVLNTVYKAARKEHTITLSNIGVVDMPDEVKDYINLFSIFASAYSMQICTCSYLDNMVMSFSTHLINTEIQKNFFRELTSIGIDVQINTNVVEEDDYEELL